VITPWLVKQVELLTRTGYSVDVFCPSYRGGGATAWSSDDVIEYPVHRFRYFPARREDLTHDVPASDRARGVVGKLKALCYMLGGAVEMHSLMGRKHFDVVHIHWPWPHMLFGVVAKAANRKVKVVATFYGAEFAAVRGKPLYRWLLRRWMRHADRVTAISSYTAGLAREFTDKKVELIPYGVTV
jgi:glycosyltransferase involved in cell wall biosynthesis